MNCPPNRERNHAVIPHNDAFPQSNVRSSCLVFGNSYQRISIQADSLQTPIQSINDNNFLLRAASSKCLLKIDGRI
ncbi:hypothetical protein CBM2615_B140198 [Cupriavidus taiwanensis]|uniref:Uncharacterized protein n=1 Tax=Cupriavidus taiwanensis TaxID=164546 RepID=A0A375E737_9BURK|nr:hypothetical protein CBM2614_B150140 [Cupriavidus taiwanensis]SOZ64363.1 hypothetical protein CBM2615_B140198 [Cupriavidus taiwanensis]SOZ68111.1 hypothetical protein CBM2613_B110197 [Cupriavidus taiwanensis]SPA07923.1 hypothetical protein CBM2625_B110198 [Cupriavidus taiwanensis]